MAFYKKMLIYYFLLTSVFTRCIYSLNYFGSKSAGKVLNIDENKDDQIVRQIVQLKVNNDGYWPLGSLEWKRNKTFSDVDPITACHATIENVLFGIKTPQRDDETSLADESGDELRFYPDGKVLRAELFNNQSSVHLPLAEYMQRGHNYLSVITGDPMQTAINAFSILLDGNIEDVLRLPQDYVLRSARAISMLKIAREKLVALWEVVKGAHKLRKLPYETLEMYRPLFKYVNAREMSFLNLKDPRILAFIGTHTDLNRHQVGVVASRYIKMNPNWTEPMYLNQMNNLLCGVPMIFMRRVSSSVYLQLNNQVFYHIRACDALQRRFFLSMMSKTETLGKSYGWSAHDVSRLGLLLAEVEGPDLAAINPEAMSGVTSHVMMAIPPQHLEYITDSQMKYLGLRSLNVLTKKLKMYHDQIRGWGNNYGCLCYLQFNMFFIVILVHLYV